jgi:hypothetical protein
VNPRTLLALLASLAVAVATLAGVSTQPANAAGAAVVPTTVQHRDANCSDFGSQASAQQYFLNHGGPDSDPDGLDSDGDGVACESNPCPCSSSQGGGGNPPTPPAQQPRFGAIALNIKGRAGTSSDVRTAANAYKQAVGACNDKVASRKNRCVRIGYVKNECAAVWFKLDGRGNVVTQGGNRARYAIGSTRARAVRDARHGHRGGRVVATCA